MSINAHGAAQARDRALALAGVLVLAAAVFAGWSLWSLKDASAGVPAYSQARDAALQAGEQAVQNFSSLDYRTVGAGLDLWEQSSTGSLRAEIVAGRAQFEKQIQAAKTITTAKVLDAALTTLDTRAGRATLIVAVQITVTPVHGSPAVKQNRLAAQLTRTASGWKLSALGQVPVGAAAASQPPGG
jgi:Mce-associated membrane protein